MYTSKKFLNEKLKLFYEYNPAFGRKIIKINKSNNTIVYENILNANYLSFYNKPVSSTIISQHNPENYIPIDEGSDSDSATSYSSEDGEYGEYGEENDSIS